MDDDYEDEKYYDVTAEVHKYIGPQYRVKVLVHDIGIYINGFMVFPANGESDWAVYPPLLGWAGKGKYRYTVEFNKSDPLWLEIHEACIEAVKEEMHLKDTINDFRQSTAIAQKVEEKKFM